MKKIKRSKARRLKRIRNKYEEVYKTPSFFRRVMGIAVVTRSGIFQDETGCTKAYRMNQTIKPEELRKLSSHANGIKLQLICLKENNERYFILHSNDKILAQAQEKFQMLDEKMFENGEQDWNVTIPEALNLESRLKLFGKFLANMNGKKWVLNNSVSETEVWRELSRLMNQEKGVEGLKTDAGFFATLAVRRYPYVLEHGLLDPLISQDCVFAFASEIAPISNRAVASLLKDNYDGLDGVMVRMKRKNPDLHRILVQDLDDGQEIYGKGSFYFLLQAESQAGMETYIRAFKQMGKERQIILEERVLNLDRAAAVFGLSGGRQEHLGRLLPLSDLDFLVPYNRDHGSCVRDAYDVEDMKKLFFDLGGNNRNEEEK